MTTHEDLRVVLIQSTLIITDSWHVLDDDCVVGVFTLLVEHSIGFNHVIDNIGFGDLLGAELPLGTEVLSVVITKMVVAGDGSELDACADQEIHESGLHLCLARLEIVTANEGIMLFG